MSMQQGQAYNLFLQSLEEKTEEGFLFHYVDQCIYITDYRFNLLGAWNKIETDPDLAQVHPK